MTCLYAIRKKRHDGVFSLYYRYYILFYIFFLSRQRERDSLSFDTIKNIASIFQRIFMTEKRLLADLLRTI